MKIARTLSAGLTVALLAVAPACGGSSNKPSAPNKTATLTEWKVALSQSSFKPGRYTFTINNAGKVEHELIAFKTDLAPADLPLRPDGSVNEEAPRLHNVTDGDDIAAGGTQTRTINLNAPGTYVFVCNLPAHFAQGMVEVIHVSAA